VSSRPISPHFLAFFLAVAAFVSALLSTYLPIDPWGLSRVPLFSEKVPILPGVYFGLVVGAAVYFTERGSILRASLSLVVVICAWMIAFETALKVYSAAKDVTAVYDAALLRAGPAAGLVGSAITVLGVSLVSPDFREPNAWLRTIAIGTVAGLLLSGSYLFKELGLLWVVDKNFLLKPSDYLFIVWQPAIAASVAYALATPKWKRFKTLSAQRAERGDFVDHLNRIAELHANGALSDEEFATQKAKFISGIK
jgi:hypothetical protein